MLTPNQVDPDTIRALLIGERPSVTDTLTAAIQDLPSDDLEPIDTDLDYRPIDEGEELPDHEVKTQPIELDFSDWEEPSEEIKELHRRHHREYFNQPGP